MMKYLILISISLLLFATVPQKYVKYLADADKASTHLDNLVFDGEFDEAEDFAHYANEKFTNNVLLLTGTGTLYIEKKDLDKAKEFLSKALYIDATNERATLKLNYIEEQERAQENKDIADLLDFVDDKGLDFLMIFLAFLGGELIAKRYNLCKNNSVSNTARIYAKKQKLLLNPFNKIRFILYQYKNQKLFSFCFFINILIILTISLVIMIVWLLIIFHYQLSYLIYSDFITMNAEDIASYLKIVFVSSMVFTIIIRGFMNFLNLPQKEILFDLNLVSELDALFNTGAYAELHNILEFLKSQGIQEDTLLTLLQRYSCHSNEIMKFWIR